MPISHSNQYFNRVYIHIVAIQHSWQIILQQQPQQQHQIIVLIDISETYSRPLIYIHQWHANDFHVRIAWWRCETLSVYNIIMCISKGLSGLSDNISYFTGRISMTEYHISLVKGTEKISRTANMFRIQRNDSMLWQIQRRYTLKLLWSWVKKMSHIKLIYFFYRNSARKYYQI